MRVLYISPVFEIGTDPGSDRYHFFCKHLVDQGHQVTVITSAVVYKSAQIRPECRGRWRTIVHDDGLEIIYLWSLSNFHGSFTRRLAYLFSYMLLTLLVGLQVKRSDVIHTVNTPGMVGQVAYWLSRLRKIPLVFEVADVWPDAAIAMGMLTNPRVISISRKMENACYHQAKTIVALTCGIKKNVEAKGISPDKIVLVTNGADPAIFENIDTDKVGKLRNKLELEGKFVCLYLGAHGHYNSLWTIVEAANCLKGDPGIAFVFVGDGDYKAELQKMVQQFELNQVIFLPPVPRSESPNFLSLGDAFLLPNRKGDFYRMNLPNKIFDFLISRRPLIVAGEGESADVVRKANAGIVVPAEDSQAMAEAIQQLAALSSEDRDQYGTCGHDYVIQHFNRNDQARRIENILLQAAEE